MAAYHRRLTGSDEAEKLRAAVAWSVWELSTSRLHVDPAYIARAADDAQFALTLSRVESHYFVNGGFMPDGQLLEDASRIAEIPGVIVQGRYDVVCPAISAWDLSKVWKKGVLKWVPDAGHSAKEVGIIHELVTATDSFRDL
jgi:proline iminopeptidase